ncbi:MAG: hypothetical protein AMDU4_FER2C00045G0003 [Ferroplasma sp. Type II]|nr:MAG: hypothetical protein AMDU4_FER2C00045G0003 [Ferroplasma sp. Type II]
MLDIGKNKKFNFQHEKYTPGKMLFIWHLLLYVMKADEEMF